jgi:hypothetical protein
MIFNFSIHRIWTNVLHTEVFCICWQTTVHIEGGKVLLVILRASCVILISQSSYVWLTL